MKTKVRKRITVETELTVKWVHLQFVPIAAFRDVRGDKPRCECCRKLWDETGTAYISVLHTEEFGNWVVCDECAAEAQAEILA